MRECSVRECVVRETVCMPERACSSHLRLSAGPVLVVDVVDVVEVVDPVFTHVGITAADSFSALSSDQNLRDRPQRRARTRYSSKKNCLVPQLFQCEEILDLGDWNPQPLAAYLLVMREEEVVEPEPVPVPDSRLRWPDGEVMEEEVEEEVGEEEVTPEPRASSTRLPNDPLGRHRNTVRERERGGRETDGGEGGRDGREREGGNEREGREGRMDGRREGMRWQRERGRNGEGWRGRNGEGWMERGNEGGMERGNEGGREG